jgi:ribose transport system substrate-binding protein
VSALTGIDLVNGKKPEKPLILIPSTLVTRENVGDYKGWNAKHDD